VRIAILNKKPTNNLVANRSYDSFNFIFWHCTKLVQFPQSGSHIWVSLV